MKDIIIRFIFSSEFDWIKFIFFGAVIATAGYQYRFARVSADRRRVLFVRLIFATIGFRIVFAAVKTWLQYYAWSHDDIGKLLLPPTQPIVYFLHYMWTHVWFNVIISFGVGLFMFLILHVLREKNGRFFEEGEVELGALMALAVGWPSFAVFFPTLFFLVLLFSIMRGILFKEPFTTLGLPFIVAAVVALLSTWPLLTLLRLTTWII